LDFSNIDALIAVDHRLRWLSRYRLGSRIAAVAIIAAVYHRLRWLNGRSYSKLPKFLYCRGHDYSRGCNYSPRLRFANEQPLRNPRVASASVNPAMGIGRVKLNWLADASAHPSA